MASKKRPTPAPWFRASLAKQRAIERAAFKLPNGTEYRLLIGKAHAIAAQRDERKESLVADIKLLRRFAHGFEPSDGYALRDVFSLSISRVNRLRRFAGLIRQEQATPHVEKVARTPSMRRALLSYTGQRTIPNRFRFLVYTERPEISKVSIVTSRKRKTKKQKPVELDEELTIQLDKEDMEPVKRVPRRSRVRIEKTVGGMKFQEQFFNIDDYTKKPPETFAQIKRILKKMLPDMPDGYYVLVTSNHDKVGAHIKKSMLMYALEKDWLAYDVVGSAAGSKDNRGLASVVIGFKLTGQTSAVADKEYAARIKRRQQYVRAPTDREKIEKFRVKKRLSEYRKRRKRLTVKG